MTASAGIGLVLLALAGCQQVTQLGGEIVGQAAYQTTYDREYKRALKRGASDAEARQLAAAAAGKESGRQKELVAGVGDVASSAGEIDYDSEVAIGQSLALEGFKRYGLPVADPELQRYVNFVGDAVARNSARPDIPYHFVVVDSPLYNAFACPGGIIFVSSTLVKVMKDEAELAGVLAHEVGHVSRRHALQSIRRARFFEGVGKITAASLKGDKGQQFQSLIGDLQSVLFDKGLDKGMEYEADAAAIETAYRTGYDPEGFLRVLKALKAAQAKATKEGSWFSTHPPLETRLSRCTEQVAGLGPVAGLAAPVDRFARYRKRVP
ncbi:MAG: M48 family metalloprotease [Deltaproteobacteria bacterium]|nr:M48 family metalloprotease [Deltaproteobacteria bacterium]